jgi:uncharacterized protein (DUF1330 family)
MISALRPLAAPLFAASLCVSGAFTFSSPVSAAEPKGYVIEEIRVTDPLKFKQYTDLGPATVTAYGGRFLVWGGGVDVIAGAPPDGFVRVLEFPSVAQAKAWHESPALQKILPIRNASSTSRVFIVEGVPP